VLLVGGLFLSQGHVRDPQRIEGHAAAGGHGPPGASQVRTVILQIMVLDIVSRLELGHHRVGMARALVVMWRRSSWRWG